MNNSLNLASKPFSNRIVPWALAAVVLFISLIGLLVVVQLTTDARKEADRAQAEINELKKHEQELLNTARQVESSFSADQQLALPAAHLLIDRKAFLWSRLLADLEGSLPNNVKVTRIAVRDVNKQGDQTIAQLDLSVFTKESSTISDMINAMHQEGIFEAEIRNQTLQKGRGENGTEYDLFVIYRPRHGYSSDSVAEVSDRRSGGETTK